MTHRTKDEWATFNSGAMLRSDLQCALDDLAELFARVEALEAECAALKAIATDLAKAASGLVPSNINLENRNLRDRHVLPCDVSVGGLRQTQKALDRFRAAGGEL